MSAEQRPSRRRASAAAALLAALLLLGACGGPAVVAVVDGTDIATADLDSLHPEDRETLAEERAASVFLLVLQHLLTTNAEDEFAITVSQEQLDAAFAERTGGLGDDLDERLAGRGTTQARVRIEAKLDVLRSLVEDEFIRLGGPGVDLDAAYRQFISVNSVSCVVMLAPTSDEVQASIEALVASGATLEQIETELPDAVERVDLGCENPVQHPPPVQSVAVDGEVGRAYAQNFTDGTFFVAGVTERDAPTLDEVMDEVFEMAARSQGRDLFDEWAFDLLRNAEVEVHESIGSWEPTPDTNGVPTVVAP